MLQSIINTCFLFTMKRQSFFLFLILLVCFVFNPLTAQSNLTNPRIKMSSGIDEKAIRLSNLAIDVSITGNIATTTFDMTFSNSSNRILEGEFEFPLDEGQTVSRYALDINGKLREGVVVEKEKGRQIFETIVRQNIDPGLVEMTSGNNFKTRVYPIPAKGSRRVVIAFEQELKQVNGKPVYILQPLTDSVVDTFEFTINVFRSSFKNQNEELASFDSLSIENWNDSYNAHIKKENYVQTKPVSFTLPSETENNAYIQTLGTDTYFYYYLPMKAKARDKKLPSSVTVFYDVSSSAGKRNRERELALLEKYLSLCHAKNVTVVTFSNEIQETKTFKGSSTDEIKKFLESQACDGATNLSEIDFKKYSKNADEILLFSDGMHTWGKAVNTSEEADVLAASVPVITVNSCASANHSMLSMISSKNNGVYVDLCSKTDEEALSMMTQETLRLLNVEYDNKKIAEVYPEKGAAVNDSFSVAGILKKKSGTINLAFGYGTKVTDRVSIEISAVNGIEAANVCRMWAQKKIANLSVFYDDNKDKILELAKKYSIVTQETSLIVLDNVEDYVRYGVTPPDELKAEYDRLVRAGAKNQNDNSIPGSVYKYFDEFKKWWNTTPEEFKKAKNDKKKETAVERRLFSGNANEALSMRREPAPATAYDDADVLMAVEEVSADSWSGNGYNPEGKMLKSSSNNASDGRSSIALQSWSPDNEYLKKLKKAPDERMYATYLELKPSFAASLAFYMEVADYFFEEGLEKEAYRILSNLAEIEIENSDIFRALGNKLVEHKDYRNAIWVFEKLTKLRSEIPQFYRDLAMACYYNGEEQKAVDTLWHLASSNWDSRFDNVQQIALNDMNSIIARSDKKLNTSGFDKKLMQNFPVDVRVVLTWNTDNCDIDLWVTDPDGEKCYYGNKLTANGGRISRDFTQGYGPEEFCLKEAPEGSYKIEANYYGTSSQKMLQPVIIQAEVFTNFGRPNQKREVLTLQLDSVKGVFTIGTVTFKK